MAVKFKFAMKNSWKKNEKKTVERTGREKKALVRWSLVGFELWTTGLRVRALTQWPLRYLVVSEAKMDS